MYQPCEGWVEILGRRENIRKAQIAFYIERIYEDLIYRRDRDHQFGML